MAVETDKVLDGLYSRLTGDSTFNTAIGGSATVAGRYRFGRAAREETLPYVVGDLISGVPIDAFNVQGFRYRVQFTVVADAPATVKLAWSKLMFPEILSATATWLKSIVRFVEPPVRSVTTPPAEISIPWAGPW